MDAGGGALASCAHLGSFRNVEHSPLSRSRCLPSPRGCSRFVPVEFFRPLRCTFPPPYLSSRLSCLDCWGGRRGFAPLHEDILLLRVSRSKSRSATQWPFLVSSWSGTGGEQMHGLCWAHSLLKFSTKRGFLCWKARGRVCDSSWAGASPVACYSVLCDSEMPSVLVVCTTFCLPGEGLLESEVFEGCKNERRRILFLCLA